MDVNVFGAKMWVKEFNFLSISILIENISVQGGIWGYS